MRINMDLSVPPEDSREAANYAELYAHLERIHAAISGRKLSQEEFSDWDDQVRSLLRSDEIARYEKPLRPHISIAPDTIQYARNFHLTKSYGRARGSSG